MSYQSKVKSKYFNNPSNLEHALVDMLLAVMVADTTVNDAGLSPEGNVLVHLQNLMGKEHPGVIYLRQLFLGSSGEQARLS